MNMRDYLKLRHKLKKRGDFSAILHFTVAVDSSIMNKTHSLKWERSGSYSAAQLYSYDRHYIWVSMSCWCYLIYKLSCRDAGLSTIKQNTGEVTLEISFIWQKICPLCSWKCVFLLTFLIQSIRFPISSDLDAIRLSWFLY